MGTGEWGQVDIRNRGQFEGIVAQGSEVVRGSGIARPTPDERFGRSFDEEFRT